MFRRPALALLCASLALAACQTDYWGGSRTPGSAAVPTGKTMLRQASSPGILLAGWVGAATLAGMDETDREKNRAAEQRAYTAPIGQQITWNDPDTVKGGTITPTRDGYASNGTYCREFRQTVTVGGKEQQGYGKACQQADGGWKIVQ